MLQQRLETQMLVSKRSSITDSSTCTKGNNKQRESKQQRTNLGGNQMLFIVESSWHHLLGKYHYVWWTWKFPMLMSPHFTSDSYSTLYLIHNEQDIFLQIRVLHVLCIQAGIDYCRENIQYNGQPWQIRPLISYNRADKGRYFSTKNPTKAVVMLQC